jgi:hypothetical protein
MPNRCPQTVLQANTNPEQLSLPREWIVAEEIRVGTGSDRALQQRQFLIDGGFVARVGALLGSKSTNSISPVRRRTHFSSSEHSSGRIVLQYVLFLGVPLRSLFPVCSSDGTRGVGFAE